MDEEGKGGIHIQAGGNIGYAAGDKSIAAGGDISGGINQQEIHYGAIQLDEKYLDRMPKEYSDSLKQFLEEINKKLQAEKIPSSKVVESG